MPVINSTLPESIREYLSYDPDLGYFFWIKLPTNRVKVGDIAGCKAINGYITIRFKGRLLYAHRLAWFFMHGCWPGHQIDHINGCRADNRFRNLRDVPQSDNLKNAAINCNNTSGVSGVVFNKRDNVWQVRIRDYYRNIFLGQYSDWFDAVCARKSAEYKLNYHPNHGRKA